MFDNEKDSLIAVGFMILFVVLSTLFFVFSKKIPLTISFGILLIMLLVYIQPMFYKRYYEFLNRKADFTRFIPVYNELGLFTKFYARLYMITLVIFLASVMALLLMDINVVANLFGDEAAFRFPSVMLGISVLALIAFSFVRGLAYTHIFNRISYNLYKINGSAEKGTGLERVISFVTSLLVFIPVVRGISMLFELRKLDNLARYSITRKSIRDLNNSEVTYK